MKPPPMRYTVESRGCFDSLWDLRVPEEYQDTRTEAETEAEILRQDYPDCDFRAVSMAEHCALFAFELIFSAYQTKQYDREQARAYLETVTGRKLP